MSFADLPPEICGFGRDQFEFVAERGDEVVGRLQHSFAFAVARNNGKDATAQRDVRARAAQLADEVLYETGLGTCLQVMTAIGHRTLIGRHVLEVE